MNTPLHYRSFILGRHFKHLEDQYHLIYRHRENQTYLSHLLTHIYKGMNGTQINRNEAKIHSQSQINNHSSLESNNHNTNHNGQTTKTNRNQSNNLPQIKNDANLSIINNNKEQNNIRCNQQLQKQISIVTSNNQQATNRNKYQNDTNNAKQQQNMSSKQSLRMTNILVLSHQNSYYTFIRLPMNELIDFNPSQFEQSSLSSQQLQSPSKQWPAPQQCHKQLKMNLIPVRVVSSKQIELFIRDPIARLILLSYCSGDYTVNSIIDHRLASVHPHTAHDTQKAINTVLTMLEMFRRHHVITMVEPISLLDVYVFRQDSNSHCKQNYDLQNSHNKGKPSNTIQLNDSKLRNIYRILQQSHSSLKYTQNKQSQQLSNLRQYYQQAFRQGKSLFQIIYHKLDYIKNSHKLDSGEYNKQTSNANNSQICPFGDLWLLIRLGVYYGILTKTLRLEWELIGDATVNGYLSIHQPM